MENPKENMDNFIRIVVGEGESKFFILIYVPEKEIYLDINATEYGDAMFLCACHDGAECIRQQSNDNPPKDLTFLKLDWIINDWGGAEEVIESAKKLKENIFKEWDKLVEDHKVFIAKLKGDDEGKGA